MIIILWAPLAIILWAAVVILSVRSMKFARELVSEVVCDRLEKLPYAILRLAARLDPMLRSAIYEDELLSELSVLLKDCEGLTLTRLVRGTIYSLGILRSFGIRSSLHLLARVRSSTVVTPDPKLRRRSAIARRLLTAAAWMVPARDRDRYEEEFRSEQADLAIAGGGRFKQVAYAIRIIVSSVWLRAVLASPRRRGALP